MLNELHFKYTLNKSRNKETPYSVKLMLLYFSRGRGNDNGGRDYSRYTQLTGWYELGTDRKSVPVRSVPGSGLFWSGPFRSGFLVNFCRIPDLA